MILISLKKYFTVIFFRLIIESIKFSFSSLINNKLRTFLSLLGITIGIFSIISVMTTIDSLERAIKDNIGQLGSNTVYIQKWPWSFGADYPWWKYINRPSPKLSELNKIEELSTCADKLAFAASTMQTIEYENKSLENIAIMMSTHDYMQINFMNIDNGRYFSQMESNTGQSVAILGYQTAQNLFSGTQAVGKQIKLKGKKLNIIGVFEKQGDNMFNSGSDELVLIPISFGKTIFDIESDALNPFILVSAKESVSSAELIDELTIIMRTIRKLKPLEEDNFSLNQASMITKSLDNIFRILDLAGIIIGGFAILVGGFGIANIMFVSVKERTKEIGIQKAIGAKSYLILIQFLTESAVLSLVGGIVGLILVWLLTLFARNLTSLNFALSFGNIMTGTLISIFVGIISGFAPARKAAKLEPIKAMNQI
ncbi:MAG: ABC transporter permease [Bacteroidales bacterium]|nr:ABC transporter permease [Bacteroidales bacterium]